MYQDMLDEGLARHVDVNCLGRIGPGFRAEGRFIKRYVSSTGSCGTNKGWAVHSADGLRWKSMLRSSWMAATTSESTGERQATLPQSTKVPRATSIPCFLGRERLAQVHLQARHRKRHANALMENTAAYRYDALLNLIPAKRLSSFKRRSAFSAIALLLCAALVYVTIA